MSIINTRDIVLKIKNSQKNFFENLESTHGRKAVLCIIFVGENAASELYVKVKKKYAQEIGVSVDEVRLQSSTTDELIKIIKEKAETRDGLIVQLPLPVGIDTQRVLAAIPSTKDIDLLNTEISASDCDCGECHVSTSDFVQPVAFAVMQILKGYHVEIFNKKIVILGKGKLVGMPVYEILEKEVLKEVQQRVRKGEVVNAREVLSQIVQLDKYDLESDQDDFYKKIKEADVVITGIGVPGFVQPDMLKEGVVLIDAGTSEDKGTVVGDIDLSCESVASVFSTSRGGVGPLTVCGLFENLKLACK